MRKLFYGLLTLAILVGSAIAVAAGPGPAGPGGPGGPGAERLLARLLSLHLTDAQKHDVAVILKQSRTQFDTSATAIREAFDGMRQVMGTDPGNEQRIREASRKIASAGEEMAVLRGKLEAQTLAVLTPEQREKWSEEEEALRGHHPRERFHAGNELVDEWINTHAGKNS